MAIRVECCAGYRGEQEPLARRAAGHASPWRARGTRRMPRQWCRGGVVSMRLTEAPYQRRPLPWRCPSRCRGRL